MRVSAILLCSAFAMTGARSEVLKDADREALLEKLEGLQKTAESAVDARFRLAVGAYREAMASDEKAKELYLKCLEKVEFTDEKRKAQDFRDWQRGQDEWGRDGGEGKNLARQMDGAGFSRALRHQLRWLVLTLEADSSNADIKKLVPRAEQIVSELFEDAKMLEGQEQLLKRAVTATVFAKAYGIDKVAVADWPLTPVDLEEIYDQLLLPPHRNPEGLSSLRNGWLKRIAQEGTIREYWARFARRLERERARQEKGYENLELPGEGQTDVNETKIGMADAMKPPEYEKFIETERPQLIWEMEKDLYKHGDQSGAAVRMLNHIDKHINHPSVRQWSEELTALLKQPAPVPPAAPAIPGGTAQAAP